MNRLLDAFEVYGFIHEVGEADRNGRKTDQAMQDRDQLRHLRHLHAPRQ